MSTPLRLSGLTGDYDLDTAHSRIGFVARHTMGTRVRGQFDEFEGGAYLDGDHPTRSSVRITMRAQSIRTGNPRRDDLLRGKFLAVDDHPSIVFTSTEVTQVDGTRFRVAGTLAVRGVTEPVTVDVELTGDTGDPQGGARVGFRGGVTLNRNDWGVNWNAGTTALVSPKVVLEFEVTAIRRRP
ncbi:YceI family protein [Streptomyces sp. NPDC048219]|uniref:YceI family protein n=1 Tax=unclassified Streptomyces TaxID=2593676 RepID=UPI003444BAE1